MSIEKGSTPPGLTERQYNQIKKGLEINPDNVTAELRAAALAYEEARGVMKPKLSEEAPQVESLPARDEIEDLPEEVRGLVELAKELTEEDWGELIRFQEKVSSKKEPVTVPVEEPLTEEEKLRLSRFRISTDKNNRPRTDEDIAAFRKNLIESRGVTVLEEKETSLVQGGARGGEEEEILDGVFREEDEETKRKEIIEDLLTVSERPPKNQTEEEKRVRGRKLREAFERLSDNGVKVDEYLKDGLNMNLEADRKEYGKRKAKLNEAVRAVNSGKINKDQADLLESIGMSINDMQTDSGEEENNNEPDLVDTVRNEKIPQWKVMWNTALALEDKKLKKRMLSNVLSKFSQGMSQDDLEKLVNQINEIDNPTITGTSEIESGDLNIEYGCTKEQLDQIVKSCFDQVFLYGASNVNQILNALTARAGLWTSMKGNAPLPIELRNYLANEFGFEAWVGVRGVMDSWSRLKSVDDVNASNIDMSLFPSEYMENTFGKIGKISLPDKNGERVEFEHLDKAISVAMKTLSQYFVNTDRGGKRTKNQEYWTYVGAPPASRAELYESLNLNKYVGEAAFSFLLSNLMLTDISAYDPFLMLVSSSKARIAKYKVSEDRDPYVRKLVFEGVIRGKRVFTLLSDDEKKAEELILEDKLSSSLPNKLVPTGLDNGGDIALGTDNWLNWRISSRYTRSQREVQMSRINSIYNEERQINQEAAKLRKLNRITALKPCNDILTQIALIKSAIEVKNMLQQAIAPESGTDVMTKLKTKLFIHIKSELVNTGWVVDNNVNKTFLFNGYNSMSADEWVSRTMLTAAETYIFTHSVVDNKDTKPVDMGALAMLADTFLSREAQSQKMSYIDLPDLLTRPDSNEFVKFMDSLWERSFEVVNAVVARKRPNQYPKWYRTGSMVPSSVVKACNDSDGTRGHWTLVKRNHKLS